MVEPFVTTPVLAERATTPIADDQRGLGSPGADGGIGVTMSERFPLAICEVAVWPGKADAMISVTSKEAEAFRFAPNRWTVLSNDPAMVETVTGAIGDAGSVIDLSHGRTVIRVEGQAVEWVLAKLFAIDFADMSFPVGTGLATSHHEISAQIRRVDTQTFDVIVFRSYARSFWTALTHAALDVGFETR